MTTDGDAPSGAGGVHEPDWIDQILERATKEVDARASQPGSETREPAPLVDSVPLPIVPDVEPRPAPQAAAAFSAAGGAIDAQPADTQPAQPQAVTPVVSGPREVVDQLAEIRWADEPQVTPASTPVVRAESALTATAVGRSAYDRELASIGDSEPEGWDKLSWQDLDGNPDQASEIRESSGFAQIVREWGPVLFAAVAIALFIRLVIVQAYHIPSPSMVPTLTEGDRVVVNRLSYRFGEIERGQVVVFEKPVNTEGENDLIKRVIGLPGETVRLVDGEVYIDDRRVEEPYLREQDVTRPFSRPIPGCDQSTPASDLCVIPEGHVFVMGDNRLQSQDGRFFGPVPIDSIVGRAFLRVWPLNNVGQL